MNWPSKTKKQNLNIRNARNSKQLPSRPTDWRKVLSRRNIAIFVIIAFTGLGAYRLFFAGAAPDNCQDVVGGRICDVDMTGGPNDTLLSMNNEAVTRGNEGWGTYYGAAFRAPTSAIEGAVPIYRVYNGAQTYHDWMTDPQVKGKEAKYGALSAEGIPFYAWDHPGVKDTVPVYRVTRAGGSTQSFFSTDKAVIDRLLAAGANDPNEWKADNIAPLVAFYAYPPNYTAAGLVNPYDCAIQENYVSERCDGPRKNLEEKIVAGDVPANNECPKTADAYLKVPFPGQLSQDCQNWWNAYMQDCSIVENFTSDRCKVQREELAKEQQRQAEARAAAAAAQAKAAASGNGSGSGNGNGNGGDDDGDGSTALTEDELKFIEAAAAAQARQRAIGDNKSKDLQDQAADEAAAAARRNAVANSRSGDAQAQAQAQSRQAASNAAAVPARRSGFQNAADSAAVPKRSVPAPAKGETGDQRGQTTAQKCAERRSHFASGSQAWKNACNGM